MTLVKHLKVILLAAALAAACPSARADILISVTEGNSSIASVRIGQSFTMPSSASAFLLQAFEFLPLPSQTVGATGKLYLFTSEYSGAPDDLPTAPFLAVGDYNPVSEHYEFSSVTLTGNTKYFVYMDSVPNGNASFDYGIYSGGNIFQSYSGGDYGAFFGTGASANFRVFGVAVPEPSSYAFLTGAAVFAGALRIRQVRRGRG